MEQLGAMPVSIQCNNPACRGSFGVMEASHAGKCPSCGWRISTLDQQTDLRASQESSANPSIYTGNDDEAESPWDLARGRLLSNRYRIIRKLGKGGMGAVYLAEDVMLQREVAVKVPFFQNYENDPRFLERFRREARIAAKFHSPRVCAVYDVGESEECHYIVMHYVQGLTLADRLAHRALTQAEALAIVRSVADTLQDAHSKEIVHRDLKPANIMLGSDDQPIIMDFGLAKVIESDDDGAKTQNGRFMGTLAYAPPEQIEGRTDLFGPACDIYAVGVILYELLTGQLPYRGSRYVVMEQVINGRAVPPSTHAPTISPELDAIVLKAMAARIPDRFQSMSELVAAIDGFQRQERTNILPEPEPPPTIRIKPSDVETIIGHYDPLRFFEPSPSQSRSAVEDSISTHYSSPPSFRAKLAGETTSAATGMKFVLISRGEFVMGSDDDADEKPPRKVRLTRSFYLGRYPVTQQEYQKACGRTPSHFKDNPKNPVERVSWLDAVYFCNHLSLMEGLPPFYEIRDHTVLVPDWSQRSYRLPTEAEWEFACRDGRTSRYGFGDNADKLGGYAWYAANSGKKTHPVGIKRQSAWGLFDMHGNVSEWCWDGYDPQYYKEQVATDPRGPTSPRKFRVVRGGNCGDEAANLRSANRLWFEPSSHLRYIGFRLARTAE